MCGMLVGLVYGAAGALEQGPVANALHKVADLLQTDKSVQSWEVNHKVADLPSVKARDDCRHRQQQTKHAPSGKLLRFGTRRCREVDPQMGTRAGGTDRDNVILQSIVKQLSDRQVRRYPNLRFGQLEYLR
jgi:hypothetical protein